MLDLNIPEHITKSIGPSGKVFLSIQKFDVQFPIRQEHMGGKLPSFVFAIAVGRFIVKGSSNGHHGMFALVYPLVNVLKPRVNFRLSDKKKA